MIAFEFMFEGIEGLVQDYDSGAIEQYEDEIEDDYHSFEFLAP